MRYRSPVRVVIADDHEMMRSSLTVFLQAYDDLMLVGEAGNSAEATALCLRERPHVLLTEIGLRGAGIVDLIDQVRRISPRTQIIALASLGEEAEMKQALAAGAFCSLPKNTAIDVLAAAMRDARRCSEVRGSRRTGNWGG